MSTPPPRNNTSRLAHECLEETSLVHQTALLLVLRGYELWFSNPHYRPIGYSFECLAFPVFVKIEGYNFGRQFTANSHRFVFCRSNVGLVEIRNKGSPVRNRLPAPLNIAVVMRMSRAMYSIMFARARIVCPGFSRMVTICVSSPSIVACVLKSTAAVLVVGVAAT
jgi:hypothetical protein